MGTFLGFPGGPDGKWIDFIDFFQRDHKKSEMGPPKTGISYSLHSDRTTKTKLQ